MKQGLLQIKQKIQDATIGAVIASALSLILVHTAMAQTSVGGDDLGSTAAAFASQQLGGIPNLISSVCYIMGITMMVGGALKMRQHAENPSQTPMAHGISRLAVGGVIAGLPPFTSWVNKTAMIGGGALQYKNFNVHF